jgi:hypothetical protein
VYKDQRGCLEAFAQLFLKVESGDQELRPQLPGAVIPSQEAKSRLVKYIWAWALKSTAISSAWLVRMGQQPDRSSWVSGA